MRGIYSGDDPAGHWTWYDADGREQLSGDCRQGRRQGMWTELYADGSPRLVATRFVSARNVCPFSAILPPVIWS